MQIIHSILRLGFIFILFNGSLLAHGNSMISKDFIKEIDNSRSEFKVQDLVSFLPIFSFSKKTKSVSLMPDPPIISNNSPVCGDGNESVELSAYGVAVTDSIRWYNEIGSLIGSGATFTLANVTDVHAGNYYAIVENSIGISNPSATTTIIVNNISSDNAYAGEDQFLCEGISVSSLNAAIPANGSGFWTADISNPPGGTIISPSLNNTILTDLSTGTYIYRWTLSNGACTDYDFDEIKISVGDILPAPLFFGDNEVCKGELLFLQGNDAPIGATYNWKGPNNFTSNDQNVYIEPATILHSGEFILTYITAAGCESEPITQNISVIGFNDIPSIIFDGPICMGDTIKLESPTFGDEYQWINPDGESLASLSNPTLLTGTGKVAIPFGDDAYKAGFWKVRIKDNSNCKVTSDSIEVKIISPPNTPKIEAPNQICEGEELEFLAPSVNDAIYNWYQTENGNEDSMLISQLQNPVISNLTIADSPQEYCMKLEIDGCFSTLEPSLSSLEQECETLLNASTMNIPTSGSNNIQFTNIGGPLWQLDFNYFAGNAFAENVKAIWQDTAREGGTLQFRIPFSSGGGTLRLVLLKGANWISFSKTGNNFSIQFIYISDDDILGYQKYFVVCPEFSTLGHTPPNFSGLEYSTNVNRIIFQTVVGFNSYIASNGLACVSVNINSLPNLNPSNNGGLCGDTLHLFSNVENLNSSYIFEWTGPDGFYSQSENPKIPFPNSENEGSYFVTVTDTLGCSNTEITTVNLISGNVNQPIISSNQPICSGEDLILNTIQFSGTQVNYNWTGPNGTSTLNGDFPNSPTFTLNNVDTNMIGNYSVSVTVNGCNSINSSNHFIDVYGKSEAAPSSNFIPGNCVSDTSTVVLFSNPSGGVMPYTFEWTGPNGFSTSVENPFLNNLNKSKSGYYSVHITDANGCRSDAQEIFLEFLEKPNLPTISMNGATCEGEEFLVKIPSYSGSNITYHWLKNGTEISNDFNFLFLPNITNSDNGTYEVFVTVNGCQSDTSNFEININSTIEIELFSTEISCADGTEDFIFNANISGGMAPYNFYWTGPNGFLSTDENPVLNNINNLQSGSYALKVEDALGCVSNLKTAFLGIENRPSIPTLNHSGNTCEEGLIQLYTSVFEGDSVSYVWTTPNGIIETEYPYLSIDSANIIDEGTYLVQVKIDGCISQKSLPAIIQIAPSLSVPNISSNMELCENEPLVLTTTTIAENYEWTGPNGFFSTLKSPSALPFATILDAGIYQLIVSEDGCKSLPSFVEVIVHEIPEAPILTSNAPICEGDELILQTNSNASDFNFQWVPPNGFTANDLTNPILNTSDNSTMISVNENAYQSGNWNIIITDQNGCQSTSNNQNSIEIQSAPFAPTANNDGPKCLGEVIHLFAGEISGAEYRWYNGDPVGSPSGTLFSTNKNPILYNLAEGTHQFWVETEINGCKSQTATMTEVMIMNQPILNSISNLNNFCEGENAILDAPTFVNANYFWTGPNGYQSFEEDATINSLSTLNSGIYTLQVNINGCGSNTITTQINVIEQPSTPIASNSGANCEGSSIQLFCSAPSNGQSVQYSWTGPNGFISNEQNPMLSSISNMDAGGYQVTINVDGCTSLPSALTQIEVIELVAPQINNNTSTSSPICEGETILLTADFFPGANYYWTGPNGFNSSVQNPIISSAENLDVGAYFLAIEINGCISSISNPTQVFVHPTPETPVVINSGTACVGSTVELFVDSPVANTYYSWYQSSTNAFVGIGDTFKLENISMNQAGEYFVIAELNNCASPPSLNTSIIIDNNPNQTAIAGDDIELCTTTNTILNAVPPAFGIGEWSSPTGAIISNPSLSSSEIFDLQIGENIFVWSLSNGNCVNYSFDTMIVIVNETSSEIADAGNDLSVCGNEQVLLSAEVPMTALGVWSQPLTQENLGVGIVHPNLSNTIVTGLEEGNSYVFYWTLSEGSCEDFSQDEVVITVDELPNEVAFAGEDLNHCDEGVINLNANAPTIGTGIWTTNGNAQLLNPIQINSEISDLNLGENVFYWTLSNGSCENYSVDSIFVNSLLQPITISDSDTVTYNLLLENINLVANDDILEIFEMTISTMPSNGFVEILENGFINYLPDPNFIGVDSFEYQVCNSDCPNQCDQAWVYFQVVFEGDVSPSLECFVPSIITPNGDGVNDELIIPCIAESPNTSLQIFNRWGDKVFETLSYQNDWQGTYNDFPLPEGSYFYVINLENDPKKVLSGYLIIQP